MPIPNTPQLWTSKLPVPEKKGHKYDRGHGVVVGGEQMTGAACLAADAMMRCGAGLCTVLAPPSAVDIYRNYRPYLIVEKAHKWTEFGSHFEDERRNAIVIGPGLVCVPPDVLREKVIQILELKRKTILDASALTAFKSCPEDLFAVCHEDTVLTPHQGEFDDLFPDYRDSREAKALNAAKESGAVIVLKGADTIIAQPNDQTVLNTHASPYLATAGSGDVLSGMIAGLTAQGMSAFDASCAAVWMHGEASLKVGPGLVASDLVDQIPGVLKELVS